MLREGVEHGPGDEDAHGGHPEEQGDQCVLDQVAKGGAASCLQPLLVFLQVQTVMNSSEKITEENIDEKANSNLSKEICPELGD